MLNQLQIKIITDEFISHFFFKKDKNYLLKEAQADATSDLCHLFFNKVIQSYSELFNPLGIMDSTSQKIMDFELRETEALEGIYENLAAVYRFQYGDAQLEIIWNGLSHQEKFQQDWSKVFNSWIEDLCKNKTFIKGILQLTVFGSDKKHSFFVENYLKAIVNEYFDLKVLMRHGIKRVYVKMPDTAKAS